MLWRANEQRNLAIDNRPERCRPPDDIDGMDKYQEREDDTFR